MNLRKLNTENSSDVNQFIQFPHQLYKGCANWVPSLLPDMHLVLNRNKHPFYKHSEADFFVIEENGKTLGRIAVLHNRNYSAHYDAKIGFFYFFDCIEDTTVSQMLLNAALDWGRQRKLDQLLGGKGFLRSSGLGILVEGFEYLPAVGIPYNFPYYDQLIKDAGFKKETDYLSGYMLKSQQPPERVYEIARRVKERNNFWVKTFKDKTEMRQWINVVNTVHHAAFQNNPGYYPSTDEEFDLVAGGMIQIAETSLIKLIMKGDSVAGFIIAYPNICKALIRTGGKIWPFGWIDILLERKRTKVIDLNGLGLLPQYHGLGANALLYIELESALRAYGRFDRVELVQIDERNFKSKSDMENLGIIWNKRHRIYHYDYNDRSTANEVNS